MLFKIEIAQSWKFLRYSLAGWNQFGEKVLVHFYPDNNSEPTTFAWSDLKVGNTICIMYPDRKIFLDMTEGIRQEDLENCFVFDLNLEELQSEAQKLLDCADSIAKLEPLSTCFSCGQLKEDLSRCSCCRLAKYCNKVIRMLLKFLFSLTCFSTVKL